MAVTAHDLDRAGATDTGRNLMSIDPQVNWRRFPPAFNKMDLLPAYIPTITYYGGDYGDDVDEASANSTTNYGPRNQQDKATLLGVAMAKDVGRPRGMIEPHQPYPVGGEAAPPPPVLTTVTPDTSATGMGPVILLLVGTGFTKYSIVRGVGRVNELKTRYVSSTLIQAMVETDGLAPGAYGVQVVDHDIESAPQTFTITALEFVGGEGAPDGGGGFERPTPQ